MALTTLIPSRKIKNIIDRKMQDDIIDIDERVPRYRSRYNYYEKKVERLDFKYNLVSLLEVKDIELNWVNTNFFS